jgi:hypothetical protein
MRYTKRAKQLLIRFGIAWCAIVPLIFYGLGAAMWGAVVCLLATAVVYKLVWVLFDQVEAAHARAIDGEYSIGATVDD